MKKVIYIVIAAAILILTAGIILHFPENAKTLPGKEEVKEKKSKKEMVDNMHTNVEPTLRAQRIYDKTLRFGDASVSKVGVHYVVYVNVENIGTEISEPKHLDITFLSNTKKVLGTVEIEVPALQPRQKIKVESDSLNEKIYEAFDYKISIAKEAKIEDK